MIWHEVWGSQKKKKKKKKKLQNWHQDSKTFNPEKVDFCSIFEVTADLCIAITWKNWKFQSTTQLKSDCSLID